jgi:hypothetical protein
MIFFVVVYNLFDAFLLSNTFRSLQVFNGSAEVTNRNAMPGTEVNKNFEEFKNECVRHLSSLQDEFTKLYDIGSYEHWFYDHAKGAFHFQSDDGRNLYFQYIDVGSYSTKRNTWMWSWNNQTTPKHVAKGLEKVRAYGEAKNFDELTTGLLNNGDEYTGWALTAIAAKLLNAFGAYRVSQEHLHIYFIFINELTEEQYNELKYKYVECNAHGIGPVAFVCQHVLKGSKLGFHEAVESDPSIEPDDDYWAWCDDCEQVYLQQGEWNDVMKDTTQMKVVCDQC